MHPRFIEYLRCPHTGERLSLAADAQVVNGRVKSGTLVSREGGGRFPVVDFIPRFVSSQNYARTFGFQWNLHTRTQYDVVSRVPISRRRFFETTKWPGSLEGELILEAGCGAGRFTEQAASTGATLLSFDYSDAVEANYNVNGWRENVLIVQADIYAMPFQRYYFDRVFCLGVLQHTPDPEAAFMALAQMAKPGGRLAVDVYRKSFTRYVLQTKYWVRPVTRRVRPEALYQLIVGYVNLMWPLARLIRRMPRIGRQLNWRLLIADHSDLGLPEEQLKQWCYLDTFDMLSPRYDKPQTLRTVRRWFQTAGFQGIDVVYGPQGVEGRGVRATQQAPGATRPVVPHVARETGKSCR